MSWLTKDTEKSVRQLLVLVSILVVGLVFDDVFRFTVSGVNVLFSYVYLLIPFLALKPVLRLQGRSRKVGLVLLSPLLLLCSCGVLGKLVFQGMGPRELTRPRQVIQQGRSTIELGDYDYGGAVGVHGIYLEQRRLIVPGLYLVKSIDFFYETHEATMFIDGPYRVRVHAAGSYDDPNFRVDKVYLLKPWLYL